MKAFTIAVLVAFVAAAASQSYYEEEIGAWHFHTYFFEVNPSKTAEAQAFRLASRQMINSGALPDCSLNQIAIGWDGPHPVSQWEMCCNKTDIAAGIRGISKTTEIFLSCSPLTIYDLEDHRSRTSWIGQAVVLDDECPCLYPELPQPRPCPVYPDYSDIIDPENTHYEIPIPGTEDYKRLNPNFNILTDKY
ncbi:DOPA 4,5-dioxygenase [Orchesella cincta]|uniref:DOPA 4,5-dioxygenase n=1 Tax=Orchesella cincta TaxID=48709 RepID=A0A1D2MGL3_ORCCI|nr:DOPA 4,5-dioxygenase [Orchesella cincta]